MAKIVYVGSARGDEYGRANGGVAGDQTGRELSTQTWYLHSKGWRVLRCVHDDMRSFIAEAMSMACANPVIGYDQYQRNTLYAAAEPFGFDPSKVTKPVETDCSALVRVCIMYALAKTGRTGVAIPDIYTGNMMSKLLKTGLFVELTESKYTTKPDWLGEGDILVTKVKGHTVVVLNNGDSYEGNVEPESYTLGERTLRRGDEGEDVRTLQEYLLKLGFSVGSAGTNGEYNEKTEDAVKAFQVKVALDDDGVYGSKTHTALLGALEAKNEVPVVQPGTAGNLTVAKGRWNLRTGPGTAYPVAAVVQGGDKLSELTAENWLPVLYKGNVVWISKKALEG